MECFHNMLETFEKSGSKKFELWASCIFHMNDSREFYHGYDMIMNRHLPEIEKKMALPSRFWISKIWDVENRRKKEAEYNRLLINNLMKNNEIPFIVSFSRKEDDFMMWDRYGDKGRGVCLVFSEYDYKFIPAESPVDSEVNIENSMSVYDVSYDGNLNDSCLKVLERKYNNFYEEAKRITNAMELFRLKLNYLSTFVVVLAPHIKTKDFDFESETRFIEFVSESDNVSFRCAKDGTMIPFVKKKVPVVNFKGVYVGPASRVKLNVQALECRFGSNVVLADRFVRSSDLSPDLF